MKNLLKEINVKDIPSFLNLISACLIIIIGIIDIVRYCILGQTVTLITVFIIEVLFAITAVGALLNKSPWLYALIAVVGFILFGYLNNVGTTLFNVTFIIQAVIACLGFLVCNAFKFVKKEAFTQKTVCIPLAILFALIVLLSSLLLGIKTVNLNSTDFSSNIWAVPKVFDDTEASQKGTLEKLDYQTQAYATDSRSVLKSAYVYLPYGYSADKQYNILYLMHGTGDDEAYWLVDFEYNKRMVDNLIEKKCIDPLIIVTPTFYVENDCLNDLEKLTYSFEYELKNDLMPAVESKYSTYATEISGRGFKDSRDHRAFAGLSRGAVTMYRSVMIGNLDSFSYFGGFSGSRIPMDEYVQNVALSDLTVNYLYVSSGNFDFAVTNQIQDYKKLLSLNSALQDEKNASLDIYPMRYHSMENWHLALYNYLQKIF